MYMIKLNLLGEKYIDRELIKLEIVIFSFVVALFLTFFIGTSRDFLSLKEQIVFKENNLINEVKEITAKINEKEKNEKEELKIKEEIKSYLRTEKKSELLSKFFFEVIASMPKEIWLEEIELEENEITLKGYSLTETAITDLMSKIKEKDYLEKLDLVDMDEVFFLSEIQKIKKTPDYRENEEKDERFSTWKSEGKKWSVRAEKEKRGKIEFDEKNKRLFKFELRLNFKLFEFNE